MKAAEIDPGIMLGVLRDRKANQLKTNQLKSMDSSHQILHHSANLGRWQTINRK